VSGKNTLLIETKASELAVWELTNPLI
jgi:hypothetical protein